MSTKYKLMDEVPNAVIADRLDVLSNAVSAGKEARDREFTMRIPAECDRDADLVLATAAKRLRGFDKYSVLFSAVVASRTESEEIEAARALAKAVHDDLATCLSAADAAD